MEAWRLLDLEYPSAASNLALEEALARHIGEGASLPTLRLWRNRRAVVIGENQSANGEVQLDVCRRLEVEVVRRFTGGGAVYHDLGNLNYSVCSPKPPGSGLESQHGIFKRALGCAVACLRVLGLDPLPVPVNALVVDGRKISGGAGAIRWGAVFYHASILVSTELETVWRVLRREQPSEAERFVQSRRLPVTSLERELGSEIPVERVKQVIKEAFAETFHATLRTELPTEQELHTMSGLVEEKYSSDEWNLRM